MDINSNQYTAQPIRVYGFLIGNLPRLIAVVDSDIKAEAIARKWKGLAFSEKQKWVRNPNKIMRVMK